MKTQIQLLLLFLCLAPWACIQHFPIGPVPSAPVATFTPTYTPTVNSTPVCGFTPVTLTGYYRVAISNPTVVVIRNLAEWNAYMGSLQTYALLGSPTPTPAIPSPPVDFTTQMLIITSEPAPCPFYYYPLMGVCEGPVSLTVNIDQTFCGTCPHCELGTNCEEVDSVAAVRQSDLPLNVVIRQATVVPTITYVPFPIPTLTPTPNP